MTTQHSLDLGWYDAAAQAPRERRPRTDTHRPSAINPEEYEFAGHECLKIEGLGDALFLREERESIRRHMARTGGTYSTHTHGGNCMVCGSPHAVYTILFWHRPTNTYIRMGSTCAAKCEMSYDDDNAFRRAIQDAREAAAGKRKALAVLADADLSGAWEIYSRDMAEFPPGPLPYEERTIRDIVRKLVTYGSMSEKQQQFLRGLLDRITRRPEIEARRKAEREAAADCPSGRVEVIGEVLSVREQDSDWGPVTKILVRSREGWKAFGTRPSGLCCERGDTVRFRATLRPSPDDPKFGFYSRPVALTT